LTHKAERNSHNLSASVWLYCLSSASHLVCPADEVYVMAIVESSDNVRSESEGHTPVILAPPSDILVRV